MVSDELPERLEALVDYLRGRRDHHVSLSEIASVTEVLIATMSTYFKAIDTSIYREFRYLSDYINRARSEISQLHPTELKTRQIPRAGRELDAIVAATEEATNTIMEAAETIMAADPADSEAYAKTVNDSVMTIFEACSFQDITGQRISKVIETLSVIEERLNRLGEVWGAEGEPPLEDEPQTSVEEPGMSGPALTGEGIDQDGVDALLSGTTAEAGAEAETATDDGLESFDTDAAFNDLSGEDAEEWDTPSYAGRPETNLSDEDIDRLMGSNGLNGPANDTEPALEQDERTAEQLVRAVEALLKEDVSDVDRIEREVDQMAEAEEREADEAESYSAREATNDEPGLFTRRAPANGAVPGSGSKVPANAKGRTTQADIDALFS